MSEAKSRNKWTDSFPLRMLTDVRTPRAPTQRDAPGTAGLRLRGQDATHTPARPQRRPCLLHRKAECTSSGNRLAWPPFQSNSRGRREPAPSDQRAAGVEDAMQPPRSEPKALSPPRRVRGPASVEAATSTPKAPAQAPRQRPPGSAGARAADQRAGCHIARTPNPQASALAHAQRVRTRCQRSKPWRRCGVVAAAAAAQQSTTAPRRHEPSPNKGDMSRKARWRARTQT